MGEIWAIRHPVSIGNELGIHQGQDPNAPGLSQKGFEQAFRIARFIRNFRLLKIWSSPLLRTMQLARVIKDSCNPFLPIMVEPGLMEITNGPADGLLIEKMIERFPEEWNKYQRGILEEPCFPGGESIRGVTERGVRILRKIARLSFPLPENHYEPGSIVVIIFHGTLLEVTLNSIARADLRRRIDFHQDNGCINFLRWTWMGLEVSSVNFTGHLGSAKFSPELKI